MQTRLLIAVLSVFASSCAHYYMPASQLETSEVSGPNRVGRVELMGIQSGANLTDEGTLQKDGSTQLQLAIPQALVGFTQSVSDKFEAGIRIQPAAPPVLRAKYQFVGLPESQSPQSGFSMAGSAGAGLLIGGATYILGQSSLHAGYRIWQRHLFTLSPSFSFASLSSNQLAIKATGLMYGGSLGYQYDWAALGWRLECGYSMGTFGKSKIGGIFPSLMLIWKI